MRYAAVISRFGLGLAVLSVVSRICTMAEPRRGELLVAVSGGLVERCSTCHGCGAVMWNVVRSSAGRDEQSRAKPRQRSGMGCLVLSGAGD